MFVILSSALTERPSGSLHLRASPMARRSVQFRPDKEVRLVLQIEDLSQQWSVHSLALSGRHGMLRSLLYQLHEPPITSHSHCASGLVPHSLHVHRRLCLLLSHVHLVRIGQGLDLYRLHSHERLVHQIPIAVHFHLLGLAATDPHADFLRCHVDFPSAAASTCDAGESVAYPSTRQSTIEDVATLRDLPSYLDYSIRGDIATGRVSTSESIGHSASSLSLLRSPVQR